MRDIGDIFAIWPSLNDMAVAIDAKPDTVFRWKLRGRIPQEHWGAVITAALLKGEVVSAEELLRSSAPMKQRGRPSHKPKRRGRRNTEVATVS